MVEIIAFMEFPLKLALLIELLFVDEVSCWNMLLKVLL